MWILKIWKYTLVMYKIKGKKGKLYFSLLWWPMLPNILLIEIIVIYIKLSIKLDILSFLLSIILLKSFKLIFGHCRQYIVIKLPMK